MITEVTTTSEFKALLKERNVVLFIFGEWSGPAMSRFEFLERWEQESVALRDPPGTRLVAVQTHGFTDAADWLYDQPQLQFRNADGHLVCLAACGTLVWLCSGVIVHVGRAFRRDMAELDRRTRDAFAE